MRRDQTCPKCEAESGDDWSRCDDDCPMPMSPHRKKPEVTSETRPRFGWFSRFLRELLTGWGKSP